MIPVRASLAHAYLPLAGSLLLDTSVAENVATLLIVGGLLMLSMIFILLLLGSAFVPPQRGPVRLPQDPIARSLRPTPYAAPRPPLRSGGPSAGAGLLPHPDVADPVLSFKKLEAELDRWPEAGLGEPRIMEFRQSHAYLRLYRCPAGRQPGAAAHAGDALGCPGVQARLEEALSRAFARPVQVREVVCSHDQRVFCDFEVSA